MTDGPFRPRGPAPGPEPDDRPPPPAPGPPRPPFATSTVTWILGVALVVVLAYITVNTISTEAPGGRGVPAGEPLPAFAAPLVIGGPDGDAQVDPDRACAVRGRAILNSCELRESGGPVALAFLATRSERCEDQIDVLERVAARNPRLRAAAVAIRGDREDVARTVRRRGWKLPVAWDRDGAVANLYAVAVCPTITLAGADGRVISTTYGLVSEADLRRRLEAAS